MFCQRLRHQFSYDGQNFGKETSIIIYDDIKYSCNTTTKTCISLIVDESTETKQNVIMIVVPVTISVVVILVIIGVIYFKLTTKASKAKIANYGDEPDQKTLSSDNRKGRENTVSELEFSFAETTDVDVFAMQYPPRKENVNVWNGGFKTSENEIYSVFEQRDIISLHAISILIPLFLLYFLIL
ncbi:unnamed protein product [Mytilus edulis]|uniref:Uncharacterized protein n=1 Tax=Mytilus edulis TaxID=6550 RepID=A0A8S3RNQ9_MYTED|nr:unnamed protein product [Mytilus edulis]